MGGQGMPGSLGGKNQVGLGEGKTAPQRLFLTDWYPEIHWPAFYILKRGPVFCVLKSNIPLQVPVSLS